MSDDTQTVRGETEDMATHLGEMAMEMIIRPSSQGVGDLAELITLARSEDAFGAGTYEPPVPSSARLIEALPFALCILGGDGAVSVANEAWNRGLGEVELPPGVRRGSTIVLGRHARPWSVTCILHGEEGATLIATPQDGSRCALDSGETSRARRQE